MKARVIVLEDDAASRTLLTLVLEEHGYEVIAFSDPSLCPVYADTGGYCDHDDACGDFLLTDNRMPVMTGLDFIDRQSQRGCKGMMKNKAVMSGTWQEQELAQAQELGCTVFEKPYNVSDILAWLEERKKELDPRRRLAVLA